MNIDISPMCQDHIQDLVALEEQCFSSPWTAGGFTAELDNPRAVFLVAVANNQLLGYMGFHNTFGEGYVTNIAVFPHHRGKGIGEALINRAIEIVHSLNMEFLSLEVRASNSKAISLYNKTGFTLVGSRKNAYDKPCEDGLVMTYYISKETI